MSAAVSPGNVGAASRVLSGGGSTASRESGVPGAAGSVGRELELRGSCATGAESDTPLRLSGLRFSGLVLARLLRPCGGACPAGAPEGDTTDCAATHVGTSAPVAARLAKAITSMINRQQSLISCACWPQLRLRQLPLLDLVINASCAIRTSTHENNFNPAQAKQM